MDHFGAFAQKGVVVASNHLVIRYDVLGNALANFLFIDARAIEAFGQITLGFLVGDVPVGLPGDKRTIQRTEYFAGFALLFGEIGVWEDVMIFPFRKVRPADGA